MWYVFSVYILCNESPQSIVFHVGHILQLFCSNSIYSTVFQFATAQVIITESFVPKYAQVIISLVEQLMCSCTKNKDSYFNTLIVLFICITSYTYSVTECIYFPAFYSLKPSRISEKESIESSFTSKESHHHCLFFL